MPRIQFRAKPETLYGVDGSVAFQRIKVPKLTSAHYNVADFRNDLVFSSYANSSLFPSMLDRARKHAGVGDYIRLDKIPPNVTVDTSGFLAAISFDVTNWR